MLHTEYKKIRNFVFPICLKNICFFDLFENLKNGTYVAWPHGAVSSPRMIPPHIHELAALFFFPSRKLDTTDDWCRKGCPLAKVAELVDAQASGACAR
jgi:hypothetical protein